MKKNIFVVALILLTFSLSVNAQKEANTSLKWYSWEEGYQLAQDEGKIIILDAYTDWCHWCKVMDDKTYSQKSVIDLIDADFVAIKLNPEKAGTYTYNGANYSGKSLINTLSYSKFSGYPTTFFVFPSTSESYMEVGYLEASVFEGKLKKYAAMKNESDGNGKGKEKGKTVKEKGKSKVKINN